MTTSPVVTDATSTTAVDIKTFNETYRVYVKLLPDGKIDQESMKVTSSGKDGSAWKKLEDAGYQMGLEQTVKIYEAGTIAGISQLVEDAEEAVNIFNRGGANKTSQKLKTVLTEVDSAGTNLSFSPTDSPFDTLELLAAPTQRRNLSPFDKAKTMFRNAAKALFPGLEGDELEAKVAAFMASAQS